VRAEVEPFRIMSNTMTELVSPYDETIRLIANVPNTGECIINGETCQTPNVRMWTICPYGLFHNPQDPVYHQWCIACDERLRYNYQPATPDRGEYLMAYSCPICNQPLQPDE
jgi:hypothetical protein